MILTPEKESEQQQQQPTVEGVDDAGRKLREGTSDEPPSYEEANAGATSTSTSQSRPGATPTSQTPISQQDLTKVPRSNFVQIDTPYRSIAGNWNIDLSLPATTAPKSPITTSTFISHHGPRPNLFLSTETRPIDARIHVSNSGSGEASASSNRALILVTNSFSNISVDLKSRQVGTKAHVCISSGNGNIIIRLPKDFHGLVRCRAPALAHNATAVRFTPKVKDAMTILSAEKTEYCVFVGDQNRVNLPGDGQSFSLTPGSDQPVGAAAQQLIKPDSWTGDEIEAVSKEGRIKVCYTLLEGEEKETEGEFETLFRHLQEAGPVVALAKFAIRGVTRAVGSRKPKDKEKASGSGGGQ